SLLELKDAYPKQLHVYSVDIGSDEEVACFAQELQSRSPSVDTVINNAGTSGESADFERLSLEEILRTFNVNVVGAMRITRALLPFLRKSQSPKVIHVTSLMGSIADNGSGGSYGYRMSKAALNMFHKSLAVDFPEIISLAVHP